MKQKKNRNPVKLNKPFRVYKNAIVTLNKSVHLKSTIIDTDGDVVSRRGSVGKM